MQIRKVGILKVWGDTKWIGHTKDERLQKNNKIRWFSYLTQSMLAMFRSLFSALGVLHSLSSSSFTCFYRTQVYLGSDLWIQVSLSPRGFADLTDVTLADEDTNSILTNSACRAIHGKVTMQVMQPVGQLWNQCKWLHLMTKCWTNASGAT